MKRITSFLDLFMCIVMFCATTIFGSAMVYIIFTKIWGFFTSTTSLKSTVIISIISVIGVGINILGMYVCYLTFNIIKISKEELYIWRPFYSKTIPLKNVDYIDTVYPTFPRQSFIRIKLIEPRGKKYYTTGYFINLKELQQMVSEAKKLDE